MYNIAQVSFETCIVQRWEFIKENKKVRKLENTLSSKKKKVKKFLFFLVVFLASSLAKSVFSFFFFTFLFSFLNSHPGFAETWEIPTWETVQKTGWICPGSQSRGSHTCRSCWTSAAPCSRPAGKTHIPSAGNPPERNMGFAITSALIFTFSSDATGGYPSNTLGRMHWRNKLTFIITLLRS